MSNKNIIKMVSILLISTLFIFGCDKYNNDLNDDMNIIVPEHVDVIINDNSFILANWNIQIFGVSKASKDELMYYYKEKINPYDAIFIQEIRDISETAFPKLCSMLDNHECIASKRSGRSSSKEQYGFIYNNKIEILEVRDFSITHQDLFERPPIAIKVRAGRGEVFWLVNIHVSPSKVVEELENLEEVLKELDGKIIIIGDLNASCSYYNPLKYNHFDNNWFWVIPDNANTTVGKSNCAYDRIIINDITIPYFVEYGIMDDVIKEQSDHYLVWGVFLN